MLRSCKLHASCRLNARLTHHEQAAEYCQVAFKLPSAHVHPKAHDRRFAKAMFAPHVTTCLQPAGSKHRVRWKAATLTYKAECVTPDHPHGGGVLLSQV